jgi:transcriptional regulator of acetoin/glycerol metabolism
VTAADRLAVARERFLTGESVAPGEVRETILASWWRSRQWNVAAGRVELSYVRDPDLDTPLTRSARPVLRDLHELLKGQPIGVILTDATGMALTRLTADHDLERRLDGIRLAPGFCYAEENVGTNGIGTALESGQLVHVFGHEHYAQDLENLACAAAPIRDPISGKTAGAVGLICWRQDAGPLLIALAKTTAAQIAQALLATGRAPEFDLLQEYLRACRHSSGIVLALNGDVLMLNEYARQALDPGDQVALLGEVTEVLASGHAASAVVELPTGVSARVHCRPVHHDGRLSGGVVHVKLMEPGSRPPAGTPAQLFLTGLEGSGPLWLRACGQVDAVYRSAGWLALAGEPGAGKLAVLRAVHQRRNPAGPFHVLDAAEATGQDWPAGARARRPRPLWVAATLRPGAPRADLAGLLQFFPSTVELPPLRHHIEDLHVLVPFFLSKLSRAGRLACSPEAMQLLLRSSWPGNTGQLHEVLRRVVQRRRAGSIQPDDLPPECWTVSRRLLSPLESMERDAITASLRDFGGSKVKAAGALGVSRATIYRKIREYGIVIPAPLRILARYASPAAPASGDPVRSSGSRYRLSMFICWASASTTSCCPFAFSAVCLASSDARPPSWRTPVSSTSTWLVERTATPSTRRLARSGRERAAPTFAASNGFAGCVASLLRSPMTHL